jgi:hypothetical protein
MTAYAKAPHNTRAGNPAECLHAIQPLFFQSKSALPILKQNNSRVAVEGVDSKNIHDRRQF